jgi:hypothetical protein
MNTKYSKQYYLDHKDKMKQYSRRYYLNNKNKKKEYDEQYRLDHINEIRERQKQYDLNNKLRKKEYRINNKNKIDEYQKQYYLKYGISRINRWRKLNREKYLMITYRNLDKEKGFVCTLTPNWIKENIISKSCIYCGDTENIGCDRIDNTKGHTQDNVIPCCYICNIVKNNIFTCEEMIKLGNVIKIIKEKRKLKI